LSIVSSQAVFEQVRKTLLYFVRVERRKVALVLRSTTGAAKLAAALCRKNKLRRSNQHQKVDVYKLFGRVARI